MSDNNTTALAKREEANLAMAKDNPRLQEMFELVKQIVPGADKAPAAVLWMAVRKAIAHDLNIFDDGLYLAEIKGRWIAHVGIKGQRTNAHGRHHFQDDDKFPRRLSEAEIKLDFAGNYKSGIIGIEVCLYNIPKIRMFKELGIPYTPRRERGYWQPGDTVPVGRHPAWVAQKHAEMQALTAEFPLQSRNASRQDAEEYLEFKGRQMQREMAIPANRPRLSEAEMDGEIPAMQYRQAADDGEFIELGSLDVDDVIHDDADAAIAGSLSERTAGWIAWARTLDSDSDSVASERMHRYLVALVNGATGQEQSHRRVLHVIFGREITSEAPEGKAASRALIDGLAKTRKLPETDDEVANPNYKPEFEQNIKTIWAAILEHEGQMTLPLEAENVPY